MSLESTTDASGNFVGWNVKHTCSKWVSFIEDFVRGEGGKGRRKCVEIDEC